MPVQSQIAKDFQNLPHILVVDDDDRLCALVSRYLNEHGFLSFTAPDAAAAKDILGVGVFDALVLDVMMPGQDGRDLTRELRLSHGDIPIILLTAMGEADDRVFLAFATDFMGDVGVLGLGGVCELGKLWLSKIT